MIRSYKFRMYPTKRQAAELSEMLGTFCWLYNRALEERRDSWRNYGWNMTFFQQSGGLKYWRRNDERLGRFSANAEVRILRRLDKSYNAFFRRIRSGEKAGFPRFKSAARFDGAEFDVGDGFTFREDRVRFVGIESTIKVKWHRQLSGTAKSVFLRREGARWYLTVRVEAGPWEAVERPYSPVGIDAGLTSLVAMTTGEAVTTPQWTKAAANGVRLRSRALQRAKMGSIRRRKTKARLAAYHRKVARKRNDFLHRLSRRIVDNHSHIAIEDLNVSAMAQSHFGKSIHNAAWTTLRNMLTYKAESAGGIVVAVEPRGTSQTCSGCGIIVPKELSVRTHDCPHCGLVLDRDLNAARNILARANFAAGAAVQAPIEPVAA